VNGSITNELEMPRPPADHTHVFNKRRALIGVNCNDPCDGVQDGGTFSSIEDARKSNLKWGEVSMIRVSPCNADGCDEVEVESLSPDILN